MLVGAYEPVENLYSEELSKLIHSMLQRDPDNRPSIKEILTGQMVVNKAKEFKITIPIKRKPKSPGCKTIFKTLKTTNSKVKYFKDSHKSQLSVLQSRNGSSNFLRKGKRSLKPKGSSVVIGDKWVNDSDFFTEISAQISDIVIEKVHKQRIYRIKRKHVPHIIN